MKVALACIGRLENRYAVEFVEYYKQLGFDHIYIADNNHDGEEHFEDVLQPYIDEQFITILNYRNKINYQLTYYKEIYYDISKDYDWIAFFDFDEFLTLTKDKNIKDYLSRNCFKPYNQILINWKIYTDNNLVVDDGRPCLERFTTPMYTYKNIMYDWMIENAHVKPLIRTKLKNIDFDTPHTVKSLNNEVLNILKKTTCNNCGILSKNFKGTHTDCFQLDIPEGSTIFETAKKHHNHAINYDLAYIKHFTTKTIDEWINNKCIRGTADRDIECFNDTYPLYRFFKYNIMTYEKLKFLQEYGYNI